MATGSFYGGSGLSLTPTYGSIDAPAMTPPSTPSFLSGQRSQSININQKLDLMLSMFMEQKNAIEETKATTEQLQKQFTSLSSDMAEVKGKMESISSAPKVIGKKKIPSQLSVSLYLVQGCRKLF